MSTEFLDFFKNADSKISITPTGDTTFFGQGDTVSDKVLQSDSFQNSFNIFQNILSGGELPNTFREQTFADNQLALGQSVVDRSNEITALFDELRLQTEIRENQRAEDQSFLKELNERLSGQVTTLGKDAVNLGKIGSGGGDFLNKVGGFLGVGATGAAIALGLVLVLVLKR